MALGQTHIIVGLVAVFIAAFMIFFVIDNLAKFSEKCKVDSSDYCRYFSSFGVSMLVILLIIGGFVITITAVGYIMIASPSKIEQV